MIDFNDIAVDWMYASATSHLRLLANLLKCLKQRSAQDSLEPRTRGIASARRVCLGFMDAKRELFFVVRDRYGIKSLFYTLVENRLVVATEMKSLLAFGWKPE